MDEQQINKLWYIHSMESYSTIIKGKNDTSKKTEESLENYTVVRCDYKWARQGIVLIMEMFTLDIKATQMKKLNRTKYIHTN